MNSMGRGCKPVLLLNGFVMPFILMALALGFSPARSQKLLQKVAPEAQITMLIKDLETGEVVVGLNAHKLMIPASLTKIVTTITALNTLGEDYRFSTQIYMRGTVKDSTLTGDIMVVGGGDPTLGSAYFGQTQPEIVLQTIYAQLKCKGVVKLKGRLIIDTSTIPEPRYPAHRLWEDMGNYYGAPPSGLSWRDNTFELYLSSPPLPGQLCKIVSTRPVLTDLVFKSHVLSASNNKDSAYIFGYPGLTDWEVRGSIPVNRTSFTIKGALPDPPCEFAKELASVLTGDQNHITIQTINNQLVDVSDAVQVGAVFSPDLSQIIQVVNQKSHNLMADHLFLALSNPDQTKRDRWTRSAITLVDFWKKRGVTSPVRIYDGSGLSTGNLLSAGFLVELLMKSDQSRMGEIFESSLAVGGQTGTLSGLWKSERWRGRVKAKSGSMEGVLGYAGYLYTARNRKLAFCVLVNNYTAAPATIRKTIEAEIGQIIDNH